MAEFDKAHSITAKIEGGYVNDPQDNGGETYKGISRKYHSSWAGWIIIDDYKKDNQLKRGDVIRNEQLSFLVDLFYRSNFWDVNRLSGFDNQDVANEIYDTGVNMGTRTAAKMLQEALNLLNRNQKDYKDLAIDGKIGTLTRSKANVFCRKYPQALLKALNGLQFMRYVEICKRNPVQERFFRGWLLRV